MTMAICNSAALLSDAQLEVAANATVEVRRESDSGLAAIFSNRDGTTPITNPSAFADSKGRFYFFAAGGSYSIKVTKDTEEFTLRHVAIGLAAERDASDYGAQLMAATDYAAALALLNSGLMLGTAQATTSGTSKDFTGVPSWARKLSLQLLGFSTNGTSGVLVQLGTSASVETSSYLGSAAQGAVAPSAFSAGFKTLAISAADVFHGRMEIERADPSSNIWTCSFVFGSTQGPVHYGSGSKTMSGGALDRVRLTTVNGTDTLDAGSAVLNWSR